MKNYKNIFPFKIGATSFILYVKKDNLIKNIQFLKNSFDKIQLLLFGKDYLDEFFNPYILDNLIKIKKENPIEYSIHLPIDLDLLNNSQVERNKSLNIIFEIIEKTRLLSIKEYILHIDKNGEKVDLSKKNLNLFNDICKTIKDKIINTDSIFIENTSYDLTFFNDIILKYNYSVCLDIGHLIVNKNNFDKFIETFKRKIKEIHIHGVKNNKDHKSLKKLDRKILKLLIDYLRNYNDSVIIEVFNKSNLIKSLELLKYYFKKGKEWN